MLFQTNCITELIPEAMQAAKACDEHFKRTGKPLGPLHGLPVSVKEQLSVGGHHTNAALVAWTENFVHVDCQLVQALKTLGAVVFVRTQEPQSFMHLETSNNIYGTVVNPRNRSLTAGGSTGGEGALLALHGSAMGFGGDIGGSIRCPASYNSVSLTRLTSLYRRQSTKLSTTISSCTASSQAQGE
jgi:amidase